MAPYYDNLSSYGKREYYLILAAFWYSRHEKNSNNTKIKRFTNSLYHFTRRTRACGCHELPNVHWIYVRGRKGARPNVWARGAKPGNCVHVYRKSNVNGAVCQRRGRICAYEGVGKFATHSKLDARRHPDPLPWRLNAKLYGHFPKFLIHRWTRDAIYFFSWLYLSFDGAELCRSSDKYSTSLIFSSWSKCVRGLKLR